MAPVSTTENGDSPTFSHRVRRLARTLFRVGVVTLLAALGVFVWGFFQSKPDGFAPTDPDEGAFITEDWIRYTIDATSRDVWVFFNFGQGRSVDATFSTANWDLAFKRTDLLTNSGATNPAGLGGAIDLGEMALEAAAPPTSAVFSLDELGGDDDDELANPSISRWYNYSFLTHTVHAKANTYLVRAGGSLDALVYFDSYYCEDEGAGCITFRYRLIPTVDSS